MGITYTCAEDAFLVVWVKHTVADRQHGLVGLLVRHIVQVNLLVRALVSSFGRVGTHWRFRLSSFRDGRMHGWIYDRTGWRLMCRQLSIRTGGKTHGDGPTG